MTNIDVNVKPLAEQQNFPDTSRTTWEHIVIENGYNEQRFICRGVWAGDTYFYVDAQGLTYERYPSTDGEPETFEQLSCGDRWTMCDGYELNAISGELSEKQPACNCLKDNSGTSVHQSWCSVYRWLTGAR